MSNNIHPTAIIDPSAQIAENVAIGPFSVIGEGVKIASGVKIQNNVYIEHAEIGEDTEIFSGAVIGTAPQDLGYKGEKTKVIIGKNNQIREHVTVNRASGEGNKTVVGDNCLLMTGAHVAHNCHLGNNVIMANLSTLGGHVHVGDFAFLGGMSVVHQNVKIGEMVIVSGFAGVRQDIPPYAKASEGICRLSGINTIGLKRRGLSLEERTNLKNAYKILMSPKLNTTQAVIKIKEEISIDKYVTGLIDFVESSKRGIPKPYKVKKINADVED